MHERGKGKNARSLVLQQGMSGKRRTDYCEEHTDWRERIIVMRTSLSTFRRPDVSSVLKSFRWRVRIPDRPQKERSPQMWVPEMESDLRVSGHRVSDF